MRSPWQCRLTSLMKPMSSMRSASSSTSQRVSARLTSPSRTRSVSRPGVAMRTSTPGAIFLTWLKRETPPSTSAVETCTPLASMRMVSSICTASSRVGARISARAVFGRRLVPSAMIFVRIGSAKAAVLPEPVWATPRMSRPASCGGMAFDLDRLGLGEAGGCGGLQQRAGDAEFGEAVRASALFSISCSISFFFHAAFGRKQCARQGATCRR